MKHLLLFIICSLGLMNISTANTNSVSERVERELVEIDRIIDEILKEESEAAQVQAVKQTKQAKTVASR